MNDIKKQAKSIYIHEPRSMDSLGFCLIKLLDNRLHRDDAKCIGIKWVVSHSEHVSCTHAAPAGKPTNLLSTKDHPTNYPGWVGRVWVRYSKDIHRFGSDPFSGSLTHTGTGGSGDYSGPWSHLFEKRNDIKIFSWDFKIFDEDWPLLREIKKHKNEQFLAKLEDRNPETLKHNFFWEDYRAKKADQKFITRMK
jgi:hypothetical protein